MVRRRGGKWQAWRQEPEAESSGPQPQAQSRESEREAGRGFKRSSCKATPPQPSQTVLPPSIQIQEPPMDFLI